MLSGSYLLVITERECVGSYLGHPIYKVSSFNVYPCDHSLRNSPAEQVYLLLLYPLPLHYSPFYGCLLSFFFFNILESGYYNNLVPLWQKKMETEFSALLNIAERTPGLYFSYEANLTLR